MATNTLIMSYVLRKFKNARSSANNRWFAYVNRQGTLSTRDLAQHMVEHGVLTNRADVEAILIKQGRQLLEESGEGVQQVAWRIGMSPKQFAKYFKEEYGLLPSDFIRKQ